MQALLAKREASNAMKTRELDEMELALEHMESRVASFAVATPVLELESSTLQEKFDKNQKIFLVILVSIIILLKIIISQMFVYTGTDLEAQHNSTSRDNCYKVIHAMNKRVFRVQNEFQIEKGDILILKGNLYYSRGKIHSTYKAVKIHVPIRYGG